MPEDGFYPEGHKYPKGHEQLFQFQRRRDPDTLKGTRHAVPVKAAVRHQNVTLGIKSEEVAKVLNSNDCAGDGFIFGNCLPEKDLHHSQAESPHLNGNLFNRDHRTRGFENDVLGGRTENEFTDLGFFLHPNDDFVDTFFFCEVHDVFSRRKPSD